MTTRKRFRPLWTVVAGAGLLLAGGDPVTSPEDMAKEALSAASASKRAAYEQPGDARRDGLLAAAGAYGEIADTTAFPAGLRAEAAFRAGEILRAQGELAAADQRFGQATALGEDGDGREFAARGLLEKAHMKRRADDAEAALGLYADVRSRFADQRRPAAHALTWRGKVLRAEGRTEEAHAALLGFAEAFPEYPAEAIRNVALVADDLLAAGLADRAIEVSAEIRERMKPVLAEGGTSAEAVEKALDALPVTAQRAGY